MAFYKAKGSWINAVVRWWTKSVYSHAELIMPDGINWIGISPFLKSRVSRRIVLDYNPSEWDIIEINITPEQRDIILEFYRETRGDRYDWFGMLLSQFLPCKIKHRKRWYCSEWIAYALRIACIFDWRKMKIYDRQDLSPAALYEIIKMCQKT